MIDGGIVRLPVKDVSDLGDLEAKVRAFGWAVARCDGHDPAAIEAALARLADSGARPRMLIADTVKGKGVSFMEHKIGWHGVAPTKDELAKALEEIKGRLV